MEEPLASADAEAEAPRPLPEPVQRSGEVDVWRGEVRTAAIAAAGGIVAGAATVAAVRAIRPSTSSRKNVLRRGKVRQQVVASRSFLVDVHVLGR